MDYSKNLLTKKNSDEKKRPANSSRSAYSPKRPFCAVEGPGSQLWEELTPVDVWVLLRFYGKFNGYNRCNLSLTYREVKNTISNGTFNKSLWRLMGFGFIEVKTWGRLEQKASIYAISDKWRNLESHAASVPIVKRSLEVLELVKRKRIPPCNDDELLRSLRFERRNRIRALQQLVLDPRKAAGIDMATYVYRTLPNDAGFDRSIQLSDAISALPASLGEKPISRNDAGNDLKDQKNV